MGSKITSCLKEIDELERHSRPRFIPLPDDYVDPLLPDVNQSLHDIIGDINNGDTTLTSFGALLRKGGQEERAQREKATKKPKDNLKISKSNKEILAHLPARQQVTGAMDTVAFGFKQMEVEKEKQSKVTNLVDEIQEEMMSKFHRDLSEKRIIHHALSENQNVLSESPQMKTPNVAKATTSNTDGSTKNTSAATTETPRKRKTTLIVPGKIIGESDDSDDDDSWPHKREFSMRMKPSNQVRKISKPSTNSFEASRHRKRSTALRITPVNSPGHSAADNTSWTINESQSKHWANLKTLCKVANLSKSFTTQQGTVKQEPDA